MGGIRSQRIRDANSRRSHAAVWPVPSRIIPLAEENELAFKRTALAAGAYIHHDGLAYNDLGDGDGKFQPALWLFQYLRQINAACLPDL